MTCTTCVHCNTDEAADMQRSWRIQQSAGYCTASGNWFCGKRVPTWIQGCPDYRAEPRTQTLTRQAQLEGLADQGIDTLEDYRMEK